MQVDPKPLALVVEDEAGISALLKDRMEAEDFRVRSVASAEEAEAVLEGCCPDLILLDYSLPGKNGAKLLEWLKVAAKEHGCAEPPPVVITTGRGDERLAVELMKLGASDYLVKDGEFLKRVVTVAKRALQEGRLKKDLREQQNRFKEIFDLSNVAKSITTPAGGVTPNPAFCELLGYTPQELSSMNWREITLPEDVPLTEAILSRVNSGASDKERFEKRYLRKDGRVVWGDISFRVKRGPDGKPEYFITSIVDITERKRSEEKLTAVATERRLLAETIAASLNEIYIFDDSTLKFKFINSAALNNLGYSMVEAGGLTPLDLKPDLSREAFGGLIAPLLEGKEKVITFFTRHRRKDGTLYPVEVHLQHMPENRVFLAVISDVTEKQKVEAALKQQTDLLRLAGRAARFGGWRVDKGKDRAFWTDETAMLHDQPPGYSPTVGEAINYYLPESRPAITEAVRACLEEGKPFDLELQMVSAKGRRFWARAIGQAERDGGGNIVSISGSFQDIDEKKRLQLQVTAALEEASRFRDAMDRVPAYVFMKDVEGRYVYANALTLKLFGCDAEGLAGRSDEEFFPPEAVALIKEKDSAVFAGGQSSGEIPVRNADGSETLYFESKVPLYSDREKKQIIGLLGISTDVTQLRRIERELKESEAFNRMLLDNLPMGIAVNSVGPGVEFSYMNDKFPALYRTTREQLARNDSFWEAVYEDPGFRAKIKEKVLADVASGDPGRMRWEDVPIRRGEKTWYVSAQDTPLPDKGLVISTVWDVTDRNEALQALQQRAKELAEAQRRARLGSYKLDVATGEFTVSEVLEEMYGISGDYPRNIEGWKRLLHPEDAGRLGGRMAEILAGNIDEIDSEHRIVRPSDGRTIWVNSKSRLERGIDGRPAVIRGSALDITERKLAELALRESEETFRRLVEYSPEGIFIQLEKKFEYLNPAALRMFGAASQAELTGTPVLDRFQPGFHGTILERMRLLMEEGKRVGESEQPAMKMDGSEFTAMISAVPFEKGGRKGAIVTLRDVTGQKAAEKERERLATAIDQAGEAVVITDKDGKILYVNPAFERVTGYGRAEALGRNPSMLKSGRQDAAFYKQMWERLRAGLQWSGRMVNRRKDGVLFTEETLISPVKDEQGRVVNYVAVKRDVTEQLALEERLRQSQKMESLGLLAGGVAHDFNNLLTGITGYAGMLKKAMPQGDPKLQDLQEILYAAERASELTKQLLIFSRREVAKPVAMDINEGVRSALKLVGRLIGEDINLVTRLAPAACVTRMDPGHFAQVLMNLAVNARDAMSKGGTLTISTTDGMLPPGAAAGSEPMLLLEVSDTGCGMTPEVMARIFEPFFTTKERGKGTGLGLPTIYSIVGQAGGEVRVASEPGKGTRFSIYLPKARLAVAERPLAAEDTQPGGGRGELVLLVEDEERLRVLGQRMLEAGGYRVVAAAGGGDALEKAASQGRPFDIVVSDLVLPGMNGRELSAELSRRGLASRFLYVSGYTDELISRHGVLEEGVSFLPKPFSPYSLTGKVREVLDGPPEKARP